MGTKTSVAMVVVVGIGAGLGCFPEAVPTDLVDFRRLEVRANPVGMVGPLAGTTGLFPPGLRADFFEPQQGDGCMLHQAYRGLIGPLEMPPFVFRGSDCVEPIFAPTDKEALLLALRHENEIAFFHEGEVDPVVSVALPPLVTDFGPADVALFEDPNLTVPVPVVVEDGQVVLPEAPVWLSLGVVPDDAFVTIWASDINRFESPDVVELELNGAGNAVRIAIDDIYEDSLFGTERPRRASLFEVDLVLDPADDACPTLVGDVACVLEGIHHVAPLKVPAPPP